MTDATTEKAAREMWCPMSRSTDATQSCIASKCMAWRWYCKSHEELVDDPNSIETGYCGLAGAI